MNSRLDAGLGRAARGGMFAVVLIAALALGSGSAWAAVDLAATKTASAGTVATGDPLTYTVAVTNNGADAAENVEVRDNLKDSLTFVSASPGCTLDQGTVNCALGTLPALGTASVEINVRADSPGPVTNTANASATGPDANTADNESSVTTTVLGRTNLSLRLRDSRDPVAAGSTFKYTLTVVNRGPDRSSGMTITDQLPPGVQFVNASNKCQATGSSVVCTPGGLAKGRSVKKVITVRPTRGGTITNSATVATPSSEVDPDSSNDSDLEQTTVTGGQPTGPPTCAGRTATIVDSRGARSGTIVGTPVRDVIVALAGNDTIRGGGGNDLICAGVGGDIVAGGLGADRVFGGIGPDHLGGLSGNDALSGGAGLDILRGGSGADRLDGGPSRDRCRGGPGPDRTLRC